MDINRSFSLEGKVALVTGGGRGIGAAMAEVFAEAGADVVLVSRTVEQLEGVAARIRGLGRQALIVTADLSDLSVLPAVFEQIRQRYGRLDILANAAGVNVRADMDGVTPEIYDKVLNTNVRSVFFVCQAAAEIMKEQKSGKIINIASMTTYRGFSGLAPYSTSKAAIGGLTRALALELAPHNIQVNAIAPGWITTQMTSGMAPERVQWVIEHTPQGKYGEPRDVALLALYMASAAGDFMTGQVVAVDGGFLAGHPWPEVASS